MQKEIKPICVIGKACFKDFAAFDAWYMKESINWGESHWKTLFYKEQDVVGGKIISSLYDKMFRHRRSSIFDEKTSQEWETRELRDILKSISSIIAYLERFHLRFDLFYCHPEYCIIGFGSENNRFIIPTEFLNIELLKNYDDLPASELKALVGSENASSLSPANALADCSVKSAKEELSKKDAEAEQLKQEAEDIKNAKIGELAEMQAEIERQKTALEAKKNEMMEVLNAKMAAAQNMLSQLKNEIFVLDTQIYSIRCFLREVVDFVELRKGKRADSGTPVILYQKIRFLDEELGKMVSIYDVDWGNHADFEDLLGSREDVVEVFCPTQKCVSLVRISKDGKNYRPDEKVTNILTEYDVFHGDTIGILVRNGENLYFGWTDDDRIFFHDNLFFTPGETVITDEDANAAANETSTKEDVAGRLFIFSILQGLLENEPPLIELPEKQSILKPSKYVIYSAADNWIEDKRFGAFSDLVKRCNEQIHEGDHILSVQRLTPEGAHSWKRGYNDRGRGYNNRTHDCSIYDNSIYQINLIECDEYQVLRYKYKANLFGDEWYESCTKDLNAVFNEGTVVLGPETRQDYTYYVSVKKTWSDADARSNFQVYEDEFINLEYMNSVWLLYAIGSKTLGNWTIGGKVVNFAYAIKYLNKALGHVKEREAHEREFILKYVPDLDNISEWPVKLSEWKLEKGVRNINDYQAKRFVKYLKG